MLALNLSGKRLLWAICACLCLSFLPIHSGGEAGAAARAALPVDALPRLGLEAYALADDSVLQAVDETGVGFVRVGVSWHDIEPTNVDPSQFNWAATDALFSRLSSRNIAPLALILDCPLWACVRDNGPLLDNGEADAAQFMGALAARYSQAPYNVHFWELWNEPDSAGGPNNQWGWGMHPDKYKLMLSWVYPAIKANDSQSVVLLGGLAYDNFFYQGGTFNPDFLPDLLDSGAASYIDAVAFHYYKNNAHAWTNIGIKAEEIRSVMAAHGGAGIPLVSTESGLTSATNFNSSEAIQARYLVQMMAHGAAADVRSIVWFCDRDFENPDPLIEVFTKSGLLRLDDSRKPAFTSMQVFASEIGSGSYIRQLGPEDGVTGSLEGYRFTMANDTRQVSLVWSNEGAQTLTIPATQSWDLVRAVSLYGETLETSPGPDDTRTLVVDLDPVYIEWGIRFTDVRSWSWEYPYVEYLASQGIVGGYQDGTFRPGNPATRAQFSKMIVLGMNWGVNPPATPTFVDVPPGNPFYMYVETAFAHGIIGGYACGGDGEPCPGTYFRPGNDITRSQIAKIVVLAKGWPLQDPPVPTFSDVPPGSTFYTYVETAFAYGIIGGYQDGTFRPGNNATRAQLSKMLALALQQP